MKRLTVVMIVILSLIALLIVFVLVGTTFFGVSSIGIIGGADGPTAIFSTSSRYNGERDLLVDETVDGADIQSVSLSLGSESVNIYEADGDSFRVIQYGVHLDPGSIIQVDKSGSALNIRRTGGNSVHIGMVYSQSWVEIYIPASYRKDLSMRLSSGSLYLHKALDLMKFEAKLSSGSMKTENPIAANDASIEVTSGDLKFASLAAKEFEIQVSSGSVKLDALSGSGKVKVTSGTVRLGDTVIDKELAVKVSSGNLRLNLPGDPSLEYTGRLSSGTIRTYFEKYYKGERQKESFATVGEGPYKRLDVEVTSGSVSIDGDGGASVRPSGYGRGGGGLNSDGGLPVIPDIPDIPELPDDWDWDGGDWNE